MSAELLGRRGVTPDSPPALQATAIQKVYGGTVALAGVDFVVQPGEIHALLGENGAGKSTLVKIIAGIESQDGGTITLFGRRLSPHHRARDVASAGCAFIHQNLALIDDMSVAENIALVAGYPLRRGHIDWRAARETARHALARLGTDLDVDRPVGEYPLAVQAVVAIARALSLNARLVVLDEPTASLHAEEVSLLFDVLGRLRSEGIACILITHRMDGVLAVCDRVTVLRNGRVVAVEATGRLTERQLMALILGDDLQEESQRGPGVTAQDEILRVTDLVGEGVGPVSFEVHSGEIVGLTGLADAGHSHIGEFVYGLHAFSSGHMSLHGQSYVPRSVRDARQRGIAYVPPERSTAAAWAMSLRENLYMNPALRALARIAGGAEQAQARHVLSTFDVRPADPEREFGTLSGGNQQKVILAKWLDTRPLLLILNSPTAAVDVGAKAEIYRRLRQSCAQGASILMISSDFEEVAALCDRAAVMVQGRIVRVISKSDLTVQAITRAAYAEGDVGPTLTGPVDRRYSAAPRPVEGQAT